MENFVVNSILAAVLLDVRCISENSLSECFCIVRRFNSKLLLLFLLLLLLLVVQLERKSGQLKFPLKFFCLSKCSNLRKYMLNFSLNCGEHYGIQQINYPYFCFNYSHYLYVSSFFMFTLAKFISIFRFEYLVEINFHHLIFRVMSDDKMENVNESATLINNGSW